MIMKQLQQAMDYKKAMITHFADLKEQLHNGEITNEAIANKSGRLIIHTPSAMLEGKVNLFDTEEQLERSFFEFGLDEFGKELEQLSPEMHGFNITAPIHMKDVTIRPLSNPNECTNMNEMVVFSNQIVGMSISME
ncbi:hypothetical protein [Radiobacillus deserti]|uniref:Uncharacterized protein n=1 Tax=Radiobacillus deserti TaxID=2594883 RepID=A0A516KIC4_9BACI|nr:hypothetical protein [Radiobacillus deserti]QDP41131.1 hypothetical protein FN924_13590 [Radiobacillus deserti]